MNEYETMRGEAERLGVSYMTIRRLVAAWKPTAEARDLITDGRVIRIRHEGLCEFIKRRGR